jgi:K+-sensing histidine kinase KdpD
MVAPLVMGAIALATEFGPNLVRYLTGSDDAEDVARKVAAAAKTITGTDDLGAAAAAMKANPEMALKFRQQADTIELETVRAYLADRQDARKRDVSLRQAGYNNYRADLMLLMAFVSLVAIIWMSWAGRLDMPDMVFAFLNMTAGALLKMIGDAFQFEFGSSRGSKEKDTLPPRR